MKYWAVISTLLALLALLALGVVFKIGLALPAKLEDMTVVGEGVEVTNINLSIGISNQTRRELAVGAVLDGTVSFGGSLIRDQHFGGTGIGLHVEPGNHILQIMVAGRPAVTNTVRFKTEPGVTNHVYIDICPDNQTRFRFKVKQSTNSFGLI